MERRDGRKSLEELNELFRQQYGGGAATGGTQGQPQVAPQVPPGGEPPAATGKTKSKGGKGIKIVITLLLAGLAAVGIIFGLHWASSQRAMEEWNNSSASYAEEPTATPEPTEEPASESSFVEEEQEQASEPGGQSATQEPDAFMSEPQDMYAGEETVEGDPWSQGDAQLPAENAYMTREEEIEWQTMEADASAVPIELNTNVAVYSGTRAFLHLINPVYSLYTEQIRIYAADNVDDVYYQSEKLAPGSVLEAVVLSKPVEAPGEFVVEYTVINVKGNVVGTYPINIEMHPAETA